jgi:hypothetical protein
MTALWFWEFDEAAMGQEVEFMGWFYRKYGRWPYGGHKGS